MKYFDKAFILKTLFVVSILVLSTLARAHAQDHTPGDPDSAPIDGGLSLLIAGGVGYGIKKLRDNKRE